MPACDESLWARPHILRVDRTFDTIVALAKFLENRLIEFRWKLPDLHIADFIFKKETDLASAKTYLEKRWILIVGTLFLDSTASVRR
jgi:hypothetical protein